MLFSVTRLAQLAVLVALTALVGSACGTVKTARVVALGDVPPGDSVRRPTAPNQEPAFVDTHHVMYRTLETALITEPPLAQYVREVLEPALGRDIAALRVDFVGYRYAYYFPSRHDDFVLRVELEAAGLAGSFEGVVRGNEILQGGEPWAEDVPVTGGPEAANDTSLAARLERIADRRAYAHRLLLRTAVERLASEVSRAAHGPSAPSSTP